MDASGSIIVAKQGNEVAMRLRSGAAHAAESFGTLSQVARIKVAPYSRKFIMSFTRNFVFMEGN